MNKIEDLKIWQKSINLAKDVYLLASSLPKEEMFGLTSQIKRSVVSIASNIAEGAGRGSHNEFRHFLSIANGSACELKTQLILCQNLNLLHDQDVDPVLKSIDEVQRMSYSFQQALLTNNYRLKT